MLHSIFLLYNKMLPLIFHRFDQSFISIFLHFSITFLSTFHQHNEIIQTKQ